MLLRKHLIGLKLKNIINFDLERLIILEFEGFDELDDIISKKLIIELMGKHSNIILIDESNIIIDSLRHIKNSDELYRDILPHTRYVFPTTDKKSFIDLKDFNEFKSFITTSEINDLPTEIPTIFNGISKNFILHIINKFNISEVTDKNLEIIYNYINEILNKTASNSLKFTLIDVNKKSKDYVLEPSDSTSTFDLNFFLDDYYSSKETNETLKNYKNSLLKIILETLKKYKKRLDNINDKLTECDDMDKYKIYGELITANLYRIPNKNVDKIELENYYDNNNLITIKLDKKHSPSVNAKRFFKKYSKLKNALEIVSSQKKETLNELNYIESVVYELETASSIDELTNIYEEICENNIFKDRLSSPSKNKFIKTKKSNLTKNRAVSFNPIKYKINNYTVLVGRNNKENDYLTLKYASKSDLWFHTKDFHGSHTILKIENNKPYPSEEILTKCAELAAKHSKAKNSSNIPVDYCEVKYVKKPSGSKPGMVIYSHNKTLYVNT